MIVRMTCGSDVPVDGWRHDLGLPAPGSEGPVLRGADQWGTGGDLDRTSTEVPPASEVSTPEVARLAGNDAYWKYAGVQYTHSKSNGSGLPPDHSVDKLAAGVGIKAAALEKCMSSPETASRVERDLGDGTAAGVSGTPPPIVRNNKTGASRALVGALPEAAFVQAIDHALDGGK